MRLFTRRRFIVAVGTCAVGASAATSAHAAGRPSTVTLWQLDPDWGEPRTTATGSDTKTRCRGRACHLAAPHRFFLTEADAIAGRLHPCCLAQPTPVTVCIDLNELMPYYRARLGGVDGRCPELPEHLRVALYASNRCVPTANPDEPPGPDGPQPPPAPEEPLTPSDPDSPGQPGDPGTPSDPGSQPDSTATTPMRPQLPATGTSPLARLAAAGAIAVAGVGLTSSASGRRTKPTDAAPRPSTGDDQEP